MFQVDLETLQGWRVHSCPGQPVPLPLCPQGKKKNQAHPTEPFFAGQLSLPHDHLGDPPLSSLQVLRCARPFLVSTG